MPPPIDPVKMYKNDIYINKLMTASENSATGIGQVLEQLMEQLGLDANSFSSEVQQVERDLGTVQNSNSAECKRFPAGNPEESLQNLMHGLAGAHTMCNMTGGIANGFIGENREFISLEGPEYDLSQPDVAGKLIDDVYDKYFTGEFLCNAEEAMYGALYNLWLRLQDLATIIEADHAMHAGDIGHLITMWK
ncbi:hypothetical protein CROQUDRAFT_133231 [Cronartium quercuum f. sp. fusiforme G11]|uniref:DUF6589 domain-containing protein n=1 Tax=Cronartium quercuum f. sp. fusiforme G11 TaxID=708437 RepID=A0A9P6NLD8_9BASI|nr:hypothetical protein CROQUDRAFT_133231 [Cronartium quercuum f. sp. fusiforme G11]